MPYQRWEFQFNSNPDYKDYIINLDDSNAVGNIQCIVIWSQTNVSFLLAIRSKQKSVRSWFEKWKLEASISKEIVPITLPDQSVDFLTLDVVHLTNSFLNLTLVSQFVDKEDQSVVFFNLLHGRFRRQWALDDTVFVHLVHTRDRSTFVLWFTSQFQRFRSGKGR